MTYSIKKTAKIINAKLYGAKDYNVNFLLTDSRSLCFPEESLFFALVSERNDAHKYIPELYYRGVRNYVVNKLPQNISKNFEKANFLLVDNTLEALQQLATFHRQQFNIPVIAITGSNGKTMIKEWIYQILSPQTIVTRSPKSYNSQIGVPLSVWLLAKHSQVAIFEAGISKPGEMTNLSNIIKPNIAILTNIGDAHQENFTSLENKCKEKLKLLQQADTFIHNADDELITHTLNNTECRGENITWSKKDQRATLYVKSIEIKDNITYITYIYKQEQHSYSLPFIDDASIQNSIIAALTCLQLGISPLIIAERIKKLEPVAMRLEVKEGKHGCTLINDSYNSDINSLDIALDFMMRRPDHFGRKRTLVISDIFQSALSTTSLYKQVSKLAKQRGVEKFIGIGKDLCENKETIEIKDKYFFQTVDEFINSKCIKNLRNEVILLKGARKFGFENITDLLVQKIHETTLEVNLNALIQNLNHYRGLMKQSTKIVCMIKADGYGAGAVEIAKTLQDQRVDYLAVAVADEGVTLRKNGITGNIIIMNPEMNSFKTLFDYDLEPEVYSFRLLNALIKAAEKEGITDFPIHIKIDSGMNRLGFQPNDDIDRLITCLHKQNALTPKSVFSHFAGADSTTFDNFSKRQFEKFDSASKKIVNAFQHKIIRHIDNSAGIEHFPERQLDMCRLGIGLYGINPITNKITKNVCALKTTILQIHKVKAGETVGYSRKGEIKKDSLIAAIPIGYADGLNRKLGNRNCYCLVNGQKAPYVGNICMDVAMIDVTDIKCKEGDRVEIFGDNLPITVLADRLETITYEVLTGISNRVKRIYFQD